MAQVLRTPNPPTPRSRGGMPTRSPMSSSTAAREARRGLHDAEVGVLMQHSVASLSSQIQNRTPILTEYDHSESRGNLRSQSPGPIPVYQDIGGAEVMQVVHDESSPLKLPPLPTTTHAAPAAWTTPRTPLSSSEGGSGGSRPSTMPAVPDGMHAPMPPPTAMSVPGGGGPPASRGSQASSVPMETRLVPTGEQQVSVIEQWLNEMLAKPPPTDPATGLPADAPPGRGLYTCGIDRVQLGGAGLDDAATDRLYRGIYTHSMALQTLLRAELSRSHAGKDLTARSLDALKKVTARLYIGGEPVLPGGAKFGRLLSTAPPAPPATAPPAPPTYAAVAAAGGASPTDGGSPAGESAPHHPPPGSAPADASSYATAPAAFPGGSELVVDIDYYKEEMRSLLEAKGQFDMRVQALHRMLEQERATVRERDEAIEGLRRDVEAKVQEAAETEAAHGRALEESGKKLEQAARMRKWLEQAVEDSTAKYNGEKDAHKDLQRVHEKESREHLAIKELLERNITEVKTQMRRLEDQLNQEREGHADARAERDDYRRQVETINEKMQAEYDEYSRMKTEYHELDRARLAAHELYDEETNLTAGLRTENHELRDKVLSHESYARELLVKISAGKRTVETVRKVVKTREKDIALLKEQVANLSAAAAAYEEVMAEKAAVERSVVMKDLELEDMRSVALARVRDIHHLRGVQRSTELELSEQKAEVHRKEAALGRLKEELAVKTGLNESLKRQLDSAVDKATLYQSKTEKLEQDLRKLSARNEELEMLNKEQGNEIKAVRLSLDQQTQQVEKLLKMAQEKEAEWQKERARLNKESEKYRREDMTIEEVAGELQNTRGELQRVNREYAELDLRYDKLKHDMKKVTESWKTVEAETKDLADRLAGAREKIETLLFDKNEVTERLTRREEELEQTRAALEEEQTALAEHREMLRALREQVAALLAKLSESEEAMRLYGIQVESERAAEQADLARHDDVVLNMQQGMDRLQVELGHANAKVAEYSLELKHRAEVQGQLNADLSSALRAYEVERAMVAERVAELKREMLSLVNEVAGDLHGSRQVTKQMLVSKDEFVKLAHTLHRESRALMITQEVDERLRMEKDVAEKVAHAAENRKRESERSAAARIEQGQTQLADEMRKRREMAVEHGRRIDELSKETMKKMMAEHLMTLDRMEAELERVKKDGYGHQTLEELARVRAQVVSLEAELDIERGNHQEAVNDRDEKISVLVDKLQQETHARRWREKYSLQLSQQLKDAKVDLIKYGHRTQLVHKGVQTAYAELWGRTMLDEMEAERAKWHEGAGGKGHEWVARARTALLSQMSSRGGSTAGGGGGSRQASRGKGASPLGVGATVGSRAGPGRGSSAPSADKGVGGDEPWDPAPPERTTAPPPGAGGGGAAAAGAAGAGEAGQVEGTEGAAAAAAPSSPPPPAPTQQHQPGGGVQRVPSPPMDPPMARRPGVAGGGGASAGPSPRGGSSSSAAAGGAGAGDGRQGRGGQADAGGRGGGGGSGSPRSASHSPLRPLPHHGSGGAPAGGADVPFLPVASAAGAARPGTREDATTRGEQMDYASYQGLPPNWLNFPGVEPPLTAKTVMGVITEIYVEKIRADMAFARKGKPIPELADFTYAWFLNRYGLPLHAQHHLSQFAASVAALSHIEEVSRFALSCGILTEEDIGVRSDALGAVDTEGRAHTSRVLQKGPHGGAGGGGAGSVLHVRDTNLLGIDTVRMNHALSIHLAEVVEKFMPTELPMDLVCHPLVADASEELTRTVGVESCLAYVRSAGAGTVMKDIDLGLLVDDRQLPQLHMLLIEALEILHMFNAVDLAQELPQLYIRHSTEPEAHCWVVAGRPPALQLSSALVELLQPAELQAVMASAVFSLKDEARVTYATAGALAAEAPHVLMTVEGVKAKWSTSVAPAFARWRRFNLLTGDRAALLVAQNPEVVLSAIMKVAAGSPLLAGQLNVDALMEQAHRVDQSVSDSVSDLVRQSDVRRGELVSCSSSLAVLRARELLRWAAGEEYAWFQANSRAYTRTVRLKNVDLVAHDIDAPESRWP